MLHLAALENRCRWVLQETLTSVQSPGSSGLHKQRPSARRQLCACGQMVVCDCVTQPHSKIVVNRAAAHEVHWSKCSLVLLLNYVQLHCSCSLVSFCHGDVLVLEMKVSKCSFPHVLISWYLKRNTCSVWYLSVNSQEFKINFQFWFMMLWWFTELERFMFSHDCAVFLFE